MSLSEATWLDEEFIDLDWALAATTMRRRVVIDGVIKGLQSRRPVVFRTR